MEANDLILNNISGYIHLNEKEKEFFVSLLRPMKLKRRQMLLKEGEICRYSSFVTSGCLRGYSVDENGFEHVLNFAPQNWWIADMYSLITQKPGVLNIEALEDTEILTLSKVNQEELYVKVPVFERFFRIIIENSLVTYQQRILDNLSLTAEERYNNFCKRYPTLITSLPSKQIAAYIGVTPEFFSKMKHHMLMKKT
ncbi:Crp/Fnr family transcriptional regulator [Mucilaginibacter sp. McL0603]|uniref:Crp/Fnr family transcriptional regulator n=1 Tax=Mucilaginibacter sp. McL0603 TaxID=3415670 RepID=UPI003CF0C1DA